MTGCRILAAILAEDRGVPAETATAGRGDSALGLDVIRILPEGSSVERGDEITGDFREVPREKMRRSHV